MDALVLIDPALTDAAHITALNDVKCCWLTGFGRLMTDAVALVGVGMFACL